MFDIRAFLLQTLTASGVAVLLLVIKAMFRDKLPPRWQYGVWGVLGLTMLVPAGLGGRYVLFNWPLVVEVLKSFFGGEYSVTNVYLPFPILKPEIPHSFSEWLFAAYVLGVVFHLVKYTVSYLRLRGILSRGHQVDTDLMERIQSIAENQNVKLCRVTAVPGLPSAFVCGVFRPVLALPADTDIDDMVLLHELLHLKSRDTVWTLVICLLRSIHWCNPLLVYCAKQAGNDLEARCDQQVLEQLEGEARRDYGRILLSMANDRFAKTPGATCVNNGGAAVRQRIEAIARFKLYPAGMELVSICAVIALAVPLIIGAEASEVIELDHSVSPYVAMASGRAVRCTTPAGAFDAYGKSVLDQNGVYRALCAPENAQAELAETVKERYESGMFPYWDTGLPCWPNIDSGYYIYNLRQISKDTYEGLFVVELNYPPDGKPGEDGMMYLAVQNLRVEKENNRWIAIPLEDFRTVETEREGLIWGCAGLPGHIYSGVLEDFRVDIEVQTVYTLDNNNSSPDPNAKLVTESMSETKSCTHLGTAEEREDITYIGLSILTIDEERKSGTQSDPSYGKYTTGTFRDDADWTSRATIPGWGPTIDLGGGGFRQAADIDNLYLPYYFDVELHINDKVIGTVELHPQEGGTQ